MQSESCLLIHIYSFLLFIWAMHSIITVCTVALFSSLVKNKFFCLFIRQIIRIVFFIYRHIYLFYVRLIMSIRFFNCTLIWRSYIIFPLYASRVDAIVVGTVVVLFRYIRFNHCSPLFVLVTQLFMNGIFLKSSYRCV